jgi:hypothetical protein
MTEKPVLYGLLAEFDTHEELVQAVQALYAKGYRKLEAYTPYPIPELAEALHFRHTFVPTIVLAGGLFGCFGAYFMQYYLMAVNYPINVGGRPLNSWPSFIPVTFELTILCAVLAAMIGMFALNGLPKLDHPLFEIDRFSLVTVDRFFLCVEAIDPYFDRKGTRSLLLSLNADEVVDVETQHPN